MEEVTIDINNGTSNNNNGLTSNIKSVLINDEEMVKKSDADKILSEQDTKNNAYSSSKSIGQTFLNGSLIQSQISTIVLLIFSSIPLNSAKIAMLVLLSLSITLQFVIAVFVIILYKSNKEQIYGKLTTTKLNTTVTSLTQLLLIFTMAITAVSYFTGINTTIPTTNHVNSTL